MLILALLQAKKLGFYFRTQLREERRYHGNRGRFILKKSRIIGRLTLFSLLLFFLSGYYPVLTFPPVIKPSIIFAQEQKQEIVASSFPKPVTLPHPGYLSTKFSSWHPGVDIATGLGMPIHSITDGEVLETGTDFWGLGNYVVIRHQNGFQSKYAHMGKIYVKVGQKVVSEIGYIPLK